MRARSLSLILIEGGRAWRKVIEDSLLLALLLLVLLGPVLLPDALQRLQALSFLHPSFAVYLDGLL